MNPARSKAYTLILVAILIWGVAGPVIKVAIGHLPPFVFILYRFALPGGLGIIALSISHYSWPKDRAGWFKLCIYNFINTASLWSLFLGYEQSSALTASIISALYPIITAISGVVWLGEHVTHKEKLGMAITLAGTMVVVLEPFVTLNQSPSTTTMGNIFLIASLLMNVAGALLAKILLRQNLNPLAVTHLSFVQGFLFTLPLVFLFYSPNQVLTIFSKASPLDHLAVFYMAFLSGTVAYALYLKGQKTIEVGETAVFSYLYPVITLPFSYFWLKESISPWSLLSCLLIVAGVVVSQLRSTHRPNHRR